MRFFCADRVRTAPRHPPRHLPKHSQGIPRGTPQVPLHKNFPLLVVSFFTWASQSLWFLLPLGLPSPRGFSPPGLPCLVVSFFPRASQPLRLLSPIGLPDPCGIFLHSGFPALVFSFHLGFPVLVVSFSTWASQPLWFLSSPRLQNHASMYHPKVSLPCLHLCFQI